MWLPSSLCRWAITPPRVPILTEAPSAPKDTHFLAILVNVQGSVAQLEGLLAFRSPRAAHTLFHIPCSRCRCLRRSKRTDNVLL